MATLTIENGYLKYVEASKTEWIPLTLLAQCRLVEWATYVAIVPPQGDPTYSSTAEIKIEVTSTYTTVASLITFLQSLQSMSLGNYAKVVIVTTGYIYEGIAPVGSAQSSAVWKIKQTSDATPFTTLWANGGGFTVKMTEYAPSGTTIYA